MVSLRAAYWKLNPVDPLTSAHSTLFLSPADLLKPNQLPFTGTKATSNRGPWHQRILEAHNDLLIFVECFSFLGRRDEIEIKYMSY